MAHLAAGRWGAAAEALRTANQREPGRLAVVRALATACLHGGDERGARRAVGQFVLDNPMCAEGWRLAAQLEWKLNQYDEAMAVLARGLERLPNSAALHRQTALFWGARGKLEHAALHADRVGAGSDKTAAHPDYLDRVAQDPKLLASVLEVSGQDDANLEMLREVERKLSALLQSQPHHADRQLALARLQVRIDELPAAMLSVQRALRASPKFVEAHRLRASILGKLGEHEQAIEILKTLIREGSNWADIHFQAAELQKARGRAEEARSHLHSAIRLNPEFREAKQLLERGAA
jgi:tetratricopeptide (TPR) repeat protein